MLERSYRILDIRNGEEELLIDFADSKYERLSTFSEDIRVFAERLEENFDMVLSVKSERRSIGGNVCSADITLGKTIVCNELSQSEE